jgi:hypothetical protein
MNLTKTVRKAPIDLNMDRQGAAYEDTHKHDPKYDDEDMWVSPWCAATQLDERKKHGHS